MARRAGLDARELAWLTRSPPHDELGQRVAWSLRDRAIDEVRWTDAVEHDELTLEQIEFSATQWNGPVFRRCVLREVSFTRTTFAHARFEDVVFERCRFQGTTLEACELLRCRFEACEFEFVTVLRSGLRHCVFDHPTLQVLDLRECDLSGTRFDEGLLEGLRASRINAATLELRGGRMVGGDLTACRIAEFGIIGVEIEGLRILDSHFERAALSGAKIGDLSLAGSELGLLAITDCPELLGMRVLESTIAELRLTACPMVAGLLIADSRVASLIAQDATLYDAAFERIASGASWRFIGGGLIGPLFVGGEWAALHLEGTRIADYVAVRGSRFEDLRFTAIQVSDPLDLRLDGDGYGDGSMTWSDARGA